jgi:hypothetical protein
MIDVRNSKMRNWGKGSENRIRIRKKIKREMI